MISPIELDELTHRAWPALTTVAVGGWRVRLSEGVTQRGNSVLPVSAPRDLDGALRRVEQLYRDRGLSPTFQISTAAKPNGLDSVLADRGYELRSPTLIQVASVEVILCHQLPRLDRAVTIDETPDEEWLNLWWSVDGRGGPDARAVARRIITACPSIYASIRDSTGIAAVGRLALVDDCGGIYCMAVRPDARRRGHAIAVLRALLEQASHLSIAHVWLQVVAENQSARALYARVGFSDTSGYHYRRCPSQ